MWAEITGKTMGTNPMVFFFFHKKTTGRTRGFRFAVLKKADLLEMLLQGLEALGADDVLDAAGIRLGGVPVHAPGCQHIGQELVAFIDRIGDLFAAFRQIDIAGIGNRDMPAFPQILHSDGYAGLAEAHLIGDVHAAHHRQLVAQDQYCLQIVFG